METRSERIRTALGRYGADGPGCLEHLAWVVTGYLLTSTAATPLFGKISDLYGRKRFFPAAIGIYWAGSSRRRSAPG